jgi:hypothetical protein
MTTEKKNLAASVRHRLYNHAKANGEDFNQLLVRFANERWLYRLSEFEFDGAILQKAIQSTFARRRTIFPINVPLALTDEFSNDKGKQIQWNAFLRRSRLGEKIELGAVITLLRTFFLPLITATQESRKFTAQWRAVEWEE